MQSPRCHPTPRITPRSFCGAVPFAVILAMCLLVAGLPPSSLDGVRSGPANIHHVQAQGIAISLPDVQTALEPRPFSDDLLAMRTPTRIDAPTRILGQEGFGDTLIELQSLHSDGIDVQGTFSSKIDGSRSSGSRSIPPGGATTLSLRQVVGLSLGSYAARLTGTGGFGAVARTRWQSGAASSFVGVPAATELLLPLMIVDTFDHTAILSLMNGHEQAGSQVDLLVRENDTGANLLAFGANLEPLGATTWDTKVETILFGRSNLPRGATGGYIGALWVKGSQPVSLLAYGDESAAGGSSAIVARPVGDARMVQHLPLIRRGADGTGGSLIGIANAERSPSTGSLRYYAADGNLVAEQALSLAPQGAIFIDLTGRGRGTEPAPDLPAGFEGSAIVTLDVPALAAVQDEALVNGKVDAIAGYNALGPDELGTTIALPVVRRTTDFVTTDIIVTNASDGATTARLSLFDGNGAALPGPAPEAVIPAFGSAVFDLRDVDAFPSGTGGAHVVADQSIAVVARDARDASTEYPLPMLQIGLSDERNSDVEGMANVRTVEGNRGIRVDMQLSSGTSGTYEAFIQEGTCSNEEGRHVHELSAVTGGRSSTVLPNADLLAVADGGHAIRLTRQGRMGAVRVACGIIPWIRGVEMADTTLSRGFVLERRSAPPVATATAAPSATPTPGIQPTQPPEATPLPRGDWLLFMPRTLRE